MVLECDPIFCLVLIMKWLLSKSAVSRINPGSEDQKVPYPDSSVLHESAISMGDD